MQDNADLSTAGVQPGQVLAGKYRIDQLLGSGGMAVVVSAYHVHLDQRVALKFLRPEALAQPETVARFAREARAAAKIKSEYVAQVFDVAELDNGVPYMVMEYLAGQDLSSWLQEHGAMAIEQAVELLLQACEAIADAHAQGIIHRDLKPPNLFCVRRSDGLLAIKVLDFGISKITTCSAADQDPRMTKTSVVFGSPLYMSPEQMLSARDVDARTDIWALGAILFELIAGHSPFVGETLPEVYARISSQPPPPLRTYRPEAPPALEAVILKCLEKDRAHRYFNVAELALALQPFAPDRAKASVERVCRVIEAAGLTSTALSLPSSSSTTPGLKGVGTHAAWGQTTRSSAQRASAKSLGWAAVALGVAVAISAAVYWMTKGRSNSPLFASSAASNEISARAVAARPSIDIPPAPTCVGSATDSLCVAISPLPSGHVSTALSPAPPSSGQFASRVDREESHDDAARKLKPAIAPIKPKVTVTPRPKESAPEADYLHRQH
jgi:eukaryotic-like serine/threonine-protein kinase